MVFGGIPTHFIPHFVMIYIIIKILVLLKITGILRRFLRSLLGFLFPKLINFLATYIMKMSKFAEDKNAEKNIIRNVRNLFRLKILKKEANDAAIKGIRYLFKLKKSN